MTSPPRSDSGDDIHPVLADFALRLEEGEGPDLETWCSDHPELAVRLRRLAADWGGMEQLLHRHGLDGEGPLAGGAEEDLDPVTGGVLERLAERHAGDGRYLLLEVVGEGGMAVVQKVWDDDLRREVAMKRIRRQDRGPWSGDVRAATLSRFLDEAQITGQLRHPGIVSVHELGVDGEGQVYFTMELVDGRSLSEIYQLVRERRERWTRTRALGVIQKVCEAMAYAHSKGVVHRDLKPANVMVGSFGEVFVMDWGLARVVGAPEPASRHAARTPSTHRQDLADSDTGLLLETMEGEVVGTVAYMSPEQATGKRGAISPRSDVYSVGALLYELAAGHAPFVSGDEQLSRSALLERVIEGPPPPLHREARDVPAELAAIVEKAMARAPDDRYASMMEMAEDLRAYLEGRVVRAHRTGAWVELQKWVLRNWATAGALATAVLLAIAGAILALILQNRRRAEAQRQADGALIATLEHEANDLWPAVPELIPAMESWLERATVPLARKADHEAVLATQRELALPYTEADELHDRRTHPAYQELRRLESQLTALREGFPELAITAGVANYPDGSPAEQLATLEQRFEELEGATIWRRTWHFDDSSIQHAHDALTEVVERMRRLADLDPLVGTIASMKARVELARTIEARLRGEDAVRWDEAIASIANREECPLYDGLVIPPQVGLVPLRRDPHSTLWEFAHLATGEVPETGNDGRYRVTGDTGVVLVLIPSGWMTMGSILPTEALSVGPNIARHSIRSETPLDTIYLDAYFIGKHELTQGQWLRATGNNPSTLADGYVFRTTWHCADLTYPVETVSWMSACEELRKLGLFLPTEAQWERAARAGTATPWWTGDEEHRLGDAENLADRLALETFPNLRLDPMILTLEDGYSRTCPVDALRPNPWGLYHVLGNVSELCRDYFVVDLRWPTRPGDGLRLEPQDFQLRVIRGGCFLTPPAAARVSRRMDLSPFAEDAKYGFRVARPLDENRER